MTFFSEKSIFQAIPDYRTGSFGSSFRRLRPAFAIALAFLLLASCRNVFIEGLLPEKPGNTVIADNRNNSNTGANTGGSETNGGNPGNGGNTGGNSGYDFSRVKSFTISGNCRAFGIGELSPDALVSEDLAGIIVTATLDDGTIEDIEKYITADMLSSTGTLTTAGSSKNLPDDHKTVTLTVNSSLPSDSFPVDVDTLAQRIEEVNNTAPGATIAKTLYLYGDETGVPEIVINRADTVITLDTPAGSTTPRIISKRSDISNAASGNPGRLFTVGGTDTAPNNAKLVVSGYVTLQGMGDESLGILNDSPVVGVEYGGQLELGGHAKVTGNAGINDMSTFYTGGSGVYAFGGTAQNAAKKVTLTLKDNAEISDNAMYDPNRAMVMGGGACLINAGFTMSGGAISGNTASSNKDAHGGGVFLAYTDFTMSGGAISGNTVGSNRRTSGGGIAVGMQGTPATFTMSGGIISGNTVNSDNAAMGGGVSVIRGSIFTMSDGTISGNTVNSDYYSWGGGVLNEGDFYFKGGEIKENVLKNSNGSTVYGGGVMNFSPDGFVMSGGAVVTPNPAGSFISPAPGVYTDTRNSIGSDGNLGVYGTLTGNGIAALLDTVDHAVSSSIKLIKAADAADASSGKPVLHDYPYQGSKAPTDRFTLGYFYGNNGLTDIATGAPVIDPTVPQTTPAQWNTAGDGTLMDKPTP